MKAIRTYADILALRSDRTIDEDIAKQPHADAIRCTTCGRVLDASTWRASERRWACPGYPGDGMTEETATALRLGRYGNAREQAPEPEPMPGYVWTGTHYERIGSIDDKAAYARALRAQADYFGKR